MKKETSGLYHNIILQHNRTPLHFKKGPEAAIQLEAYNMLCGDHFQLYLSVVDGYIKEASFQGYGCAISKAATSVLIDEINGMLLAEAQELCQLYLKIVHGESEADASHPDFEAFAAARDYPSRMKCASLTCDELLTWLKKL